MSSYNLLKVNDLRITGAKLHCFALILRVPIVGNLILSILKKANLDGVITFAEKLVFDYPLYYPLHKMSQEEKDRHEEMTNMDGPSLIRHLALEQKNLISVKNGTEPEPFRHWTIHDYTSRYKKGEVTPTNVIEYIIKSVQQEINPKNPIIIHMNQEILRREAAASTERYANGRPQGVLDGVPIAIKDEIPTLGYRVTYGTSFISEVVTEDKVCLPVRNLLNEGAIIIGKTNQHEIGLGTSGSNVHHGPARNPYNEQYYTGGSSSGSAAAVAMGLVPLAVGSDGGGSIRIPSSLCGVVGLKPTFKRIPIDCNLAPSVVHIGPIAGSISDAAIAYSIMANGASTADDFRNQSSEQPSAHLFGFTNLDAGVDRSGSDPLKGLRVGVFWPHIEDADANVVKETKRAIEFFKCKGANIVDITLPNLQEIHVGHSITILTEMALFMGQHVKKGIHRFQPETQVMLKFADNFSNIEFLAAQRIRGFAMRHIEDLFRNQVDVIVSPATASIAPQIREDTVTKGELNTRQAANLMRYVVHGNLCGIPAIVFPIGYDEETDLPISLQVQGGHWREDLLFKFARVGEGILENGVKKPSFYVDTLGSSNISQ